jgi:hypothetical protein
MSDANSNDKEPAEKRIREWLQFIVNVVLALIGVIAVCIYGGQLSEMRKAQVDTHTAAEAAKDAAKTARDTLASSDKSGNYTLEEMQKQSIAMQDAANHSADQVAGIKESNRINRESLESVQRSFITYLRTDANRMRRGQVGTYFYDFAPVFQNSGATPAKVVGSYVSTKWADQRDQLMDESRFEGGNPSFASLTIGPKAEQPLGPLREEEASVFGVDLGSDLSRFHEGKMDKLLVIWAWIAYRDIFPGTKLHLTEFCDATYGARLSPVSGVAFYSRSCVHHNCTDEDCPDYSEIVKLTKSNATKPAP